jgi:hypothetical protein
VAEAFLRANGFQLYSLDVPENSPFVLGRRVLYVWEKEYRDALEILIFHGDVVGLAYLNAISVLLGRDLRDLLPPGQLAAARELLNRANRHDTWQPVTFIFALLILPLSLPLSLFFFGAFGLVLSILLPVALFYLSERRQAHLRDHIRFASLPTAEVVVDLATRGMGQYAVFLRSFGVLRRWLKGREAHRALLVDRYERQIVEGMRLGAHMPVVALTDPDLRDVPVVGACRFSVKGDTAWEEFVANILKGASVIVVHVTEVSQGLSLEVKMIRDCGLMPRTVFILGDPGSTTVFFDATETTTAGAKVLPSTVFGPSGLSEFISAFEDIKSSSIKS